ncbi:MAG: NUDIX hydrolase N-terminal domain-containing protein [Eubacterium ventriosum]
MTINDKWIDFAIRLQSIAQAGLQYGKDKYDKERYEEIRSIAAEMISVKTDIPVERVYDLFCNETGYQTPKVDTRAAVFIDGKILLVHENNGTWSLPGGWCDVNQSVASNTEKEVREESGLTVKSEKIIAVQDWRKHNVTNYAYGVIKIFVQCKYEFGEFEKNIETTEIGFFWKDEIPENLSVEKCTREQLLMCFEAYGNPEMPTIFE